MEQMNARFQLVSCSESADWSVGCGFIVTGHSPAVTGDVKHELSVQRHSWFRNPVQTLLARRTHVWILALAGFLMPGLSGQAQGVQHLSITQPGGMPGLPVMTGIQATTNGIQISWDGPSGYYQLYQKSRLLDPSWQAVGNFNLNRTTTITNTYSNTFFRVLGPAPHYAGAQTCAECHGNIHDSEVNTAHAQAFLALQQIQQDTNPSCLPCHTVGYGLPTGFTNALLTPQLEGVQCENCHGPAANHAANPGDPTAVPRVELAAQVCGGCHTDNQHPTFDEWETSAHAAVVPDVLQSMAASTNSITSCGQCHSGSVRIALLHGENPSLTLTNDYNVALVCSTCHDPHSTSVWTNSLNGVIAFTNSLTGNGILITNNQLGLLYTNQLRCALASTNDFYLAGSTVFTNGYNPAINLCAQCHNDRGAAWTDTSRAPHHSPQYNMLLGSVGELAAGPTPGLPSTHSRLEMQCAECHMQTTNNSTGHTFEVATYNLCFNCHSDPAGLVQFVSNDISNQVQQTKSLLDLWAANKAPAALQTNGTVAWEYTTTGDLSPGGTGPNAAGQALIPDDIKKARFDLYLVLYDGSYGVHNGPYDIQLLQSAQNWVDGQLYQ